MRVGYYVGFDKYMGWTKWDYKTKYLELKNWVQSGNYLKVNGFYICNLEEFELFCKVYAKSA